jgi:hypothetical protein
MTSPDHCYPCWLAEGLHVDDLEAGMPATWWNWAEVLPATVIEVRQNDNRPDRVVWDGDIASREERNGSQRRFSSPSLPECERMWVEFGESRWLFPVSGRFWLFVGARIDNHTDLEPLLARIPAHPVFSRVPSRFPTQEQVTP